MPKLTTLSFRIVPSLLRNFTKPPHLTPLLTFPLSLIPLSLSPQPKLLLLPKRVASLLKPLNHSVPLSRCALRRRCLRHPPLLPLCPLKPPLRLLLLPPYPLRCPKTPNFQLPHFSLPPPHYLPLLKGLQPPLILTCLLRRFPCLRPLYPVLIRKKRCVLFYTTLLQFQSNQLHSRSLSHARLSMNSTLKPLLSCLPSTPSTAFSLKKPNRSMIIFSIPPSLSCPKKKWTLSVILRMLP